MSLQILNKYINVWGDFPGDTVVKNPPVNAGDARNAGWIPGWGRSPGAGNGNPLQYSCQESSTDTRAWGTTTHRVAKSQTWLATEHMTVLPNLSTFLDVSLWKPLPTFWSTTLAFQDHLWLLPERDQRSFGPPGACVDKAGLVLPSALFFTVTVASAIFVSFPNAVCGFLTWLSHSGPAESRPWAPGLSALLLGLPWAGALCSHLRFHSSLDSPSCQAEDAGPASTPPGMPFLLTGTSSALFCWASLFSAALTHTPQRGPLRIFFLQHPLQKFYISILLALFSLYSC